MFSTCTIFKHEQVILIFKERNGGGGNLFSLFSNAQMSDLYPKFHFLVFSPIRNAHSMD